MKKNFKAWLLWLLCLAMFALAYLFANDAWTFTMLLCVLLIPLAFIAVAAVLHKRIHAELSCMDSVSRGQTICGTLRVHGAGILPVGLSATLECRNLRTGECQVFSQELCFSGGRDETLSFTMNAIHSGVLQIRLCSVSACDIFDIVRIPCKTEAMCECVVRPQLFETEITLSQSNVSVPESSVYAAGKTGDDPSETVALREYIPGDMIKKIHWKMSGKLGKVMVREFGFPVIEQVMVLLETSTTRTLSGEEYDAIADVFYSVLTGLSQQHIDCAAGYLNSGSVCLHKILTSEDVETSMSQWLRIPGTVMGESCAEAYAKTNAGQAVSHFIFVGERENFNPTWFTNGGKLVSLRLSEDAENQNATEGGLTMVLFSAKTYTETLSKLDF